MCVYIRCTEACPVGTYGVNCSMECDCQNLGVCDKGNGVCYCSNVQNLYAMTISARPLSQNPSVWCFFSGWTGISCTLLCPDGYYGVNCSETCPCVEGRCDPISGNCSCYPGYVGQLCATPCQVSAGFKLHQIVDLG